MLKKTNSFKSNDGETEIFYYTYTPEDTPKGIILFIHGMCEHAERYEHFAEKMCGRGFLFCSLDMLGHGRSVKNADEYGFFGTQNGYVNLREDVEALRVEIRKIYRFLPVVIVSHSMGSFVARDYAEYYGDRVDGIVLLSTCDGNDMPLSKGIFLTSALSKICGKKHKSEFVKNQVMKLLKWKNGKEFEWLSNDVDFVRSITDDKFDGKNYTLQGFNDIFRLLKSVSREEWAGKVPLSLPFLLLGGDSDPVASYGEGVKKVGEVLKDAEVNIVDVKIFEGCRHELLNEKNREEIHDFIADWADKVVEGALECMTTWH